MERTFVLLKPDCIQRKLIGRVIARFEDKYFDVVAMKMMQITPELAKQHYAEHAHKDWYPDLEEFITSGPVVAMVIEGPEVVRVVREMVGATNGLNAAFGTIRGDYCDGYRRNLVHASDSPTSAQREIGLFFPIEEK
jgi:nucleoside-diphosphate kinase